MATATKPKPAARSTGKPTFVEVNPNAANTMEALREMGYDSFASVMDLIDNSIDAKAQNIAVTVRETSKASGNIVIDIVDDGSGMDDKQLAEALRLGSDTEHNAKKDLGKFGMGLVTASISMAKNLWILTRQPKKQAFEATFDLDTITRQNKFVITLKPFENSKRVIDTFGADGGGTAIRLSQIDRINDTNPSRFANNLRQKLGQTYRHFLKDGLRITVNDRRVQHYDPLMLDHPETEVVLDSGIDLGDGTRAKLKVVELPDLGQIGDAEANIFPHNSGFYVVRNRREIISAETFGFYRHHHSYSHFRAELSYSGNSTAFHEDIKKASIHPDDKVRRKLEDAVKKFIVESGKRGRERGDERPVMLQTKTADLITARLAPQPPAPASKSDKKADDEKQPATGAKGKAAKSAPADVPAPPSLVEFSTVAVEGKGRFFHAEQVKDGTIKVYYDEKHPLVRLVNDQKTRHTATLLDMMTFSLAKAELEAKGDVDKLMNEAGKMLAVLAKPE